MLDLKGYTKAEILNGLSNLYRLQEEGKNVSSLIAEYEILLNLLTDEELDEERLKKTKGGVDGRSK